MSGIHFRPLQFKHVGTMTTGIDGDKKAVQGVMSWILLSHCRCGICPMKAVPRRINIDKVVTAASYIQYHAQTDINHVSLLKRAEKTVDRNATECLGAVPFQQYHFCAVPSWHRHSDNATADPTKFWCAHRHQMEYWIHSLTGHCLIGVLDSSYRMPPAFPRLMPAVGSSCESPNASLYTVVCFRGLLRLPSTTAGAVDGGGSSSSRGTIPRAGGLQCSQLAPFYLGAKPEPK
jgi:hypothetical protein